jgi:NADPH2:quinone reductase
VVARVGPQVDPALLGRQVISSTGGAGGYAERARADADGLIPVPDGLDLAQAVALLADGRTAIWLLRAAAVRAGDTVRVEAAAGGVGSLLVQLARNAGARVVAAAGGQRKLRMASQLGASVTVDYTEPGWTDRLLAQLGRVDVVFDGVGGQVGRAALDLVRDGGRYCGYGMASGAFVEVPEGEAARRGLAVLRGVRATPQQLRELTCAALVEAAAGRIRPVIGQTFPLERAADAHAAIQARETVGKTLLLVGAEADGPQ